MIISIIIIILLIINFSVILKSKNKIKKVEEIKNIKDIECILILGAGIKGDKPTFMLEDRLLTGISLYQKGIAPKIIMSGDHGKVDYDEVNLMKKYAIKKGVPSEDIFMDHAGFSSYESIYRAKEIFKIQKMIIVTQKYHLYRALYIAESFKIQAYGVSSNLRKYYGQFKREIREVIARDKDFVKSKFKPKPKYLGEQISIHGNGDITNDK